MTVLVLEPESAALSIKRRVELMNQCREHIIATVARYQGLKSFEDELEKHGITQDVGMVVGVPAVTSTPDSEENV